MNAPVKKDLVPITADLFKLETIPAKITGNFAEMKELVKATIEQHVLLVTPETVQGGKSLAADFRKTSKALMAAWKDKRTDSMTDILLADEQVKAMCKLLDDGATEISEQVKKIEQEAKDKCLDLLVKFRSEYWFDLNVEPEFQKADIEDLVKLGSLTPKGDLTKAAKSELEQRCKLDKAWQDKIAFRVAILETECFKNGITPPLTRASIEPFLASQDDAEFGSRLKSLIDAEITRKDEAERKMREKLEREHAEKQRQAVAAALAAQQAEANRLAQIEAANKMAEQENEAREREEVAKQRIEENRLKSIGNSIFNKVLDGIDKHFAEKQKEQGIKPVPDDAVMFTVTVHYKTEIKYPFATKPGTDPERIKAYFKRKAVADGIPEENIISIAVSTDQPSEVELLTKRLKDLIEIDARYPNQSNKAQIRELQNRLGAING